MQNGKKALIAMSGGVDSSVAACLMKQQCYTCIGVTMKLYDNEEIGVSSEKTCCTLKDVEDARFVAQALDMPYYVLNFKDKFEEELFSDLWIRISKAEHPIPASTAITGSSSGLSCGGWKNWITIMW